MLLSSYDQIIREHFDISDSDTRKAIVSLKEDTEQTQLLAALANNLYEKIVDKVADIDFGSIERSRGDITKIDNYDSLMECLNIIRRILEEYKQDTKYVDVLLAAVENIKSRKAIFVKAFALNAPLPKIIYNTMTLSVVISISFLISACIEYIKDPETNSIEIAFDKVAYNNTKDNSLFEQIVRFNKLCLDPEFDETLRRSISGGKVSESAFFENFDDEVEPICTGLPDCKCPACLKVNVVPTPPVAPNYSENDLFGDEEDDGENLPMRSEINPSDIPVNGCADGEEIDPVDAAYGESGIGTAVTAVTTTIKIGAAIVAFPFRILVYFIKSIIPFLRYTVYFLYNLRAKTSDYFAIQAQLLEMNAIKLQYAETNDMTAENKAKIIDKQLKKADKMKNIANKLAIDNNKAKKQTINQIEADNKAMKISDVEPSMSDELKSSLALF